MPLASVDPIRIGAGYYLEPKEQVAAKPYKLLRQALERSSRVAVAKYAWSGRERLGLLRVRGEAIVLHAMLWPGEIRDPSSLLPAPVEVSQEEVDGALALMDTMTVEELTGPGFGDEYTKALSEIIVAKREHREPPAVPEPDQPEGVLDLMAAPLNASVARARESRQDGTPADVHELAKPKKSAKKTPAKKTAAKKAAAKKAPGKSPRAS